MIPEDVRAVCHDVLRHRIGLTYEAEAENITTEEIITDILNNVIVPYTMIENENDILRRVRKIEIKTRGLSNEIFAGKYHTAFRGRGMSFSEVREYRAGDDVRDIDWNVTARSRSPHIKVYEEERELTMMLHGRRLGLAHVRVDPLPQKEHS